MHSCFRAVYGIRSDFDTVGLWLDVKGLYFMKACISTYQLYCSEERSRFLSSNHIFLIPDNLYA